MAVSRDAVASRDAAVGRDAAAAGDGKLAVDSKPTPSADPGGCSCDVHSSAGAGSLVSLALLSLLALVLRRRRVPGPARRG